MQDKLTHRVRELLKREGVAFDRRLVAAVSGGPDSLVMLHILQQIFGEQLLAVAHINHGLRSQAVREAEDLAALAHTWSITFHATEIDVTELSKLRGWSIEEAGRHARYEFLARLARQVGAPYVAAGHNADDQAETILMHLLRGSGIAGLRGMSVATPLAGESDLTLLRPLLTTTRQEIEAYCAQYGLQPFVDESNAATAYTRNRVRHELLPALKAYNPQIGRHLRHFADVAGAEDDILRQITDEIWPKVLLEVGPTWLVLDRLQFQELPLALRRRVLRHAFAALRIATTDLSFTAVEQALAVAEHPKSGAKASLTAGLELLADHETLLLTTSGADVVTTWPQLLSPYATVLPVPGRVDLANGWVLYARLSDATLETIVANPDPWHAYLGLGAESELLVRPRQDGERMQPLGMHGRSTSLQDLFVNRKVPGRLRALWPIVSTGDHAVWVVGHAIDGRMRVKEPSDRIVMLSCEPNIGCAAI